ncbi:uncharacterized protein LOC135075402 [Ostrinia nubilalis]|uniref:uncharacterized protein LOC135075402 n=1 Tax=Ostrinia nubilalis TaxID=29057 RepID=UPI0030825D2D
MSSENSDSGSGLTLSLVAQFDDINRLNAVLNDGAAEECFLAFVKQMEWVRSQWASAEAEAARLQTELDEAHKTLSKWEAKFAHVRKLLDGEKRERNIVLKKYSELSKLLEMARDLLFNDNRNKLNDETLQKLAFLNGTAQQDHNAKLSGVPELNSTGTLLSEMSYSRSEDDLDISLASTRRSWVQRGGWTARDNPPATKKRRSSTSSATKTVELQGGKVLATATTTLTLERAPTNHDLKPPTNFQPISESSDEAPAPTPTRKSSGRVSGIHIPQLHTPSAPPRTDSDSVSDTPRAPPQRTPSVVSAAYGGSPRARPRQHNFVAKNFYKRETCGPCGKTIGGVRRLAARAPAATQLRRQELLQAGDLRPLREDMYVLWRELDPGAPSVVSAAYGGSPRARPRQHNFVAKNFYKRETCGPCGKTIGGVRRLAARAPAATQLRRQELLQAGDLRPLREDPYYAATGWELDPGAPSVVSAAYGGSPRARPRQHNFVAKNFYKRETCGPCGKTIGGVRRLAARAPAATQLRRQELLQAGDLRPLREDVSALSAAYGGSPRARPRQHNFVAKNFYKRETCGPCGKTGAQAHPECRALLPLPCVPPGPHARCANGHQWHAVPAWTLTRVASMALKATGYGSRWNAVPVRYSNARPCGLGIRSTLACRAQAHPECRALLPLPCVPPGPHARRANGHQCRALLPLPCVPPGPHARRANGHQWHAVPAWTLTRVASMALKATGYGSRWNAVPVRYSNARPCGLGIRSTLACRAQAHPECRALLPLPCVPPGPHARRANGHQYRALLPLPCVPPGPHARRANGHQYRALLPLPCVPPGPHARRANGHQEGSIADYAPSAPPMVPALLVHCINEVEKRGLGERGIYRISAVDKDVKRLKERFLRGCGSPQLANEDIHVLCGCIKDFLRSLREPLVSNALWSDFMDAAKLSEPSDATAAVVQAVSQLPQPNRDTLAFLALHLQKVAESPECEMGVENLAKIFGPTIVGYGLMTQPAEMYTATAQMFNVMQLLLRLPAEYWAQWACAEPASPPAPLARPKGFFFSPADTGISRKKRNYFQ